jgi:hypothetical protein
MGRAGDSARGWRGVATTLFALVLLFRFLAPAGYMVDARAPSHGLVICTGHGPLALGGHDPAKAPAQKASDAACAFAGAVTPVIPPLPLGIAQPPAVAIQAAAAPLPRDLAPGRGFAAPPPPAQAPPLV